MKCLFTVLLLLYMSLLPGNANAGQLPDTLPGIPTRIANASLTGKTDTAAAGKQFRQVIADALLRKDFFNTGQAYYALGEMQYEHKNHNRSLGAFINAKDYFMKCKAEKQAGLANFRIGRAQYFRGNYKMAGGHLNYAMRTARELKLPDLEADVLEYLGMLYHVMPNPGYQDSSLLKRSLHIKQQLADTHGSLRILEKLAVIYYDVHCFDSALLYSQNAIRLAEQLGLQQDATISRLGQVPILLRLEQIASAYQILQRIQQQPLDTANLNLAIRYYTQAGNYYMHLADTATAKRNYNTAIAIAQNTGFPEMYALVYRNMAAAAYYRKDFKTAYEQQLMFNDKVAALYSQDNFSTFRELEYIFKTNTTEDELRYLAIQNKAHAEQLRYETRLRWILLSGIAGFIVCSGLIFILYRRQRMKNRVIEKQAADLQTLMKEIHHRVKNNLQVIAGLLDLQSHTISDPHAAIAIRENRNRVQTMALIHDNLYGGAGITGIQMQDYIHNLVNNLFASYNVKENAIRLTTHIDRANLPVDAMILVGLVLNELISNALKYAFVDQAAGELTISFLDRETGLLLEVKDNGPGFSQLPGSTTGNSLGYKLVKAFAQKLKASLETLNDAGACTRLYIPKNMP